MEDIIIFYRYIEEHFHIHHEDENITTPGEAAVTIDINKSHLSRSSQLPCQYYQSGWNINRSVRH